MRERDRERKGKKEERNMDQRGRVEKDEAMLIERDRKRPKYRMREEDTET